MAIIIPPKPIIRKEDSHPYRCTMSCRVGGKTTVPKLLPDATIPVAKERCLSK